MHVLMIVDDEVLYINNQMWIKIFQTTLLSDAYSYNINKTWVNDRQIITMIEVWYSSEAGIEVETQINGYAMYHWKVSENTRKHYAIE